MRDFGYVVKEITTKESHIKGGDVWDVPILVWSDNRITE
jgi:hypothetical protein